LRPDFIYGDEALFAVRSGDHYRAQSAGSMSQIMLIPGVLTVPTSSSVLVMGGWQNEY